MASFFDLLHCFDVLCELVKRDWERFYIFMWRSLPNLIFSSLICYNTVLSKKWAMFFFHLCEPISCFSIDCKLNLIVNVHKVRWFISQGSARKDTQPIFMYTHMLYQISCHLVCFATVQGVSDFVQRRWRYLSPFMKIMNQIPCFCSC